LQKASRSHDEVLDSVFVNAIRWPTQNRHSRSIDNKSVLGDILAMLEQEKVYLSGPSVWKQMIVSSAAGAKDDPSRWELVVRSCRCLSIADPSFWPDHVLMKNGLAASEALQNAELASDLIWRSVENYRVPAPTTLGLGKAVEGGVPQLSPMYIRPHVAYMDLVKAMTVCLTAKDTVSRSKILRGALRLKMPTHELSSLCLLCLKGYANAGDVRGAEELFVSMKQKGIKPGYDRDTRGISFVVNSALTIPVTFSMATFREEFYGALLQAYGASNQLNNAHKLWQSLELGELGVRPGPECYDGYILGCIRNDAWNDAISAYLGMKSARLSPSPAVCQGVFLAYWKLNGMSGAKSCLLDFLDVEVPVQIDFVLLALSTLIPELKGKPVNLDFVRRYLRSVSETDSRLRVESLNLVRSLRTAELEEQRTETPALSMDAILARRKDTSLTLLRHVVAYLEVAGSFDQVIETE
jgi:pentatricopeptide repeat protein